MKRFLIGAFVVGFWLIMMGSLVWEQSRLRRQEEKSHEMPTSELGRQWEDVEEWMEIVSQGSRIGVAMSSIRALDYDDAYQSVSRIALDRGIGAVAGLRITAVAKLDPDFNLDRFSVSVASSVVDIRASGFVYNNALYIKFTSEKGRERGAYWPLKAPVSLFEAVRPLAARNVDLTEGSSFKVSAFDPIWFGRAGDARIEVGERELIEVKGEEILATRLETTLANNKVVSWIDQERRAVRYQMLGGVVFERMAKDEALEARPDFAIDPALPEFDIETFARNLELIDLSQGNPMGTMAQILFELAGPGS